MEIGQYDLIFGAISANRLNPRVARRDISDHVSACFGDRVVGDSLADLPLQALAGTK